MEHNNTRNLSIRELVDRLKEESVKKRDLIVSTNSIKMNSDGDIVVSDVQNNEKNQFDALLKSFKIDSPASTTEAPDTSYTLRLLDCFESQLASVLNIPRRYYDKCPAFLRATNVNHWLTMHTKENIMLRTFNEGDGQGIGRAFLSDHYNCIDNYDVLFSVLNTIKDYRNIEIESCDVTEKKMYLRMVDPSIEVQATELLRNYKNPNSNGGKPALISGFVVSNSETGHGAFNVSPRGVFLACMNGLTRKSDALKKYHVGAQLAQGEIVWSEETKRQNLLLIMNQLKDAITTFLSADYWGKVIADFVEQGAMKLEKPIEATKNCGRILGVPESEMDNLVNIYMNSGQFNRFGVVQSLTFWAHEQQDADLQASIENDAYELLPVMHKYDREMKRLRSASEMIDE